MALLEYGRYQHTLEEEVQIRRSLTFEGMHFIGLCPLNRIGL